MTNLEMNVIKILPDLLFWGLNFFIGVLNAAMLQLKWRKPYSNWSGHSAGYLFTARKIAIKEANNNANC